MDDFERQIYEDELKDRAEIFGRMSPIEYGRLRKITPQRVYHWIRNKRLAYDPCGECGRATILVSEADRLLYPSQLEEAVREEEARVEGVDLESIRS